MKPIIKHPPVCALWFCLGFVFGGGVVAPAQTAGGMELLKIRG